MRKYGPIRAITGATLAGLGVLLTAGCSSGDPMVHRDEVAKQASAALEGEVGRAPDDITCPEDLPAKVGASVRCELTDAGETIGVTVTTVSVDDGKARLDVQVDEAPVE